MSRDKICYVGFDTSNYTTSAAVCDAEGRIIANIKEGLPVRDGERGLRQSDAVFAHTKNLPIVSDRLRDAIKDLEPVAVAFSATPRMAEGSYMPCFLTGKVAAHAFAAADDLPIYETAHQNGHVMAAMYSSGAEARLNEGRFLAFHVSGGTTEALLVTPGSSDLDVELVGATNDINAGQAIDRIGVMMGLRFPCGAELERLASGYKGRIEKREICVRNCNCSLSGVENIAKRIYEESTDREKTAAFVFDFICRTLIEMTSQIMDKYGTMPVLFAGGVMSNKLMRAAITERFEAYFAQPEFSADNAAGVALICRRRAIIDSKE